MKTLLVLALVALIASCHFDKLFTAGGGTQLSHDPPAGLAFATRPGNARAGQQLSQVRVAVVDSRGTPVAGADSLITVALGANPGSATLTGTSQARAANGVATFADLRISKAGTGYTLTATVAGLTPDTSDAFDVMPEPMTSSVAVTTNTTGPSPDTDGYTATLDAGPSQPIASTGSVTFSALASGSHTVVLTDVAANCTVSGGNSQTVGVAEGTTATAAFAIDCPTPTPTTGDLTVTTTTGGTGTLDPDGYTVTVDNATSLPIVTNNASGVTFTGLTGGSHKVELTGVAANCTVTAPNPRMVNVPAGGATRTDFAITCSAPANLPPTAAFAPPSCNFLDCSFTSTSSDPDGSIVSYSWNFGDGTALATAQNPSHSYGTAGTYPVTLTVTDNQGAQDNVSHSVTVQAPPPPNQAPVVSAGTNPQNVLVGALFSLEGASFSDPDNGPWNVTIDWGDGSQDAFPMSSAGTINRTHSYPVTVLGKDYQLRVTVEDARGAQGSATKTVSVTLL
jgi:PKD repeat protein